jgi:hypothetical protein
MPDESYLPRWLQIPIEIAFGFLLTGASMFLLLATYGIDHPGPRVGAWAFWLAYSLPVAAMILWSLRYVLRGRAKARARLLATLVTLGWVGALVYVSTY